MKTKLTAMLTVLVGAACMFPLPAPAEEQNPAPTFSNAVQIVRDEGTRAFTIGQIKAAFMDRKDIPGRYIRVRFDGKTLQLAGFAPSEDAAKTAEKIARDIAKPETVQTFWGYDAAITNRGAYTTFFGELAEDGALKAKVLASLSGPAVRPQFSHAEIIHVSVHHGDVAVYIVADAPPGTFELDPFVKPIAGVTTFACRVVTTY